MFIHVGPYGMFQGWSGNVLAWKRFLFLVVVCFACLIDCLFVLKFIKTNHLNRKIEDPVCVGCRWSVTVY